MGCDYPKHKNRITLRAVRCMLSKQNLKYSDLYDQMIKCGFSGRNVQAAVMILFKDRVIDISDQTVVSLHSNG